MKRTRLLLLAALSICAIGPGAVARADAPGDARLSLEEPDLRVTPAFLSRLGIRDLTNRSVPFRVTLIPRLRRELLAVDFSVDRRALPSIQSLSAIPSTFRALLMPDDLQRVLARAHRADYSVPRRYDELGEWDVSIALGWSP